MEKRLITCLLTIFLFNLIFADVNKGGFYIGGLRIENSNNANIFLAEESYTINEDELFHCKYKIYNKGKSDTITFLLNIITEIKEQGVNYSETLIPEDFNIIVSNKKIDFVYKGEDSVLKSNDVFVKGVYAPDISGDIVFSSNIKSNEYIVIEVNYSKNTQNLNFINFAQDIKYNSDYKRNVTIINSEANHFICKISTWNTGDYGEYENEILNLFSNYFYSPNIHFKRRNNEIILDYINYESNNIGIYSYTFLEDSPYSIYKLYSNSIGFESENTVYFSKTEIPKLNLFFLNTKQLWMLRNAFYALHGYKFKNNELTEFFLKNLSGYAELIKKGFAEESFNAIEKRNIELIKEMENMKEPILLSDYL